MNRTGLVFEAKYKEHILSPLHPESPIRLEEIARELEQSGLLEHLIRISPLDNNEIITKAILDIHSNEHFSSVNNSPNVGDIAYLAVAGVLGAVDAVFNSQIDNAFCAVRPPGHHAHNNGVHNDGLNQGEGFCFYNNIAIAAKYAIKKYSLKKILIVDWDYHHGNGTEWSFYDNSDVFFFSTHNLYNYPGTGSEDRTGTGEGKGFNINVPLPQAAEDKDILDAWNNILIKKLEKKEFHPDLVLISAGFDSREGDPIGSFRLSDRCFEELTKITMNIADKYCDGRLISILEGGYNPKGLAQAVNSHIKILLGI
jgi:acetoin utilization deacetylase AcuC-like enzyme